MPMHDRREAPQPDLWLRSQACGERLSSMFHCPDARWGFLYTPPPAKQRPCVFADQSDGDSRFFVWDVDADEVPISIVGVKTNESILPDQ
jgi:hypothetical protein